MQGIRLAYSTVLLGAVLCAQTLDTAILGTVTDPTGAVIAGAAVTITHPDTGLTRSVNTSSDGKYEVRYLAPGEYTVEVRAPGFRTERRTGLTIQIGQQARLDFALQVGDVVETIEVSAAGPLLQTENATLGQVVAHERIVAIPLNGRNFLQLAALTPGVVVREESNAERTRVIANGARDIWMQVNINGVTAVNNRHNFVNFYPSIDAIQEFKVQSGNYSAEYGGNAGANINMQLRSGTNRFHGALFEFLRNDHLDARGYFRPQPLPKDILRRNQFGAVISGPAVKDQTFFLAGYEGMRAQQERAGTSIVLTEAMRRGDFSGVSGAVTDPLDGRPFPGNVIPPSRLNPVSVNLINSYTPLPNVAGAVNYAGVQRDDVIIDQGLTRLDHTFSPKDQIMFHYIYSRRDFPARELNPFFFYNRNTFPNSSLGIQHVRTFSPTLLNEARFGFHRGNIARLSPRTGTDFRIEQLGILGLAVGGPGGRPLRHDEQGFPVINIDGFMGMGDGRASSNLDDSRTDQFVDNVSWIRGSHALKMGLDLRNHRDDATTNNWPFGNMSFTRDIAGHSAAAYMLGFPRTFLTPEGVPISKVRQWRWGFYLQDDWKATSRLTLNLGLRYDLFGLPKEKNGVSRTLRFDLDPRGPVLWPEPGQIVDLWRNEYHYLSPRLGLAYRFRDKTVARMGYGIFYTAAQFDNVNILQLNPPVAGSLTIINPSLNPPATIRNPTPPQLVPANPLFNVVTLPPDRKRRNAYVQNWNLQVSRELTANDVLEAGWVGSKGTFVDTSLNNFNSPEPGPGDIQARRPYQGYARIRMMVADVNTIYHSLQAQYQHRFSHGLSLTAAYTWSHLIDDAGQTINRGACQCQSARQRGRFERADSIDDRRHRLVAGYVWDLPWGKTLPAAPRFLLSGWQFGGIVTLSSGNPFNVTQSGDSQNVENFGWARPHVVPGQKPRLDHRRPTRWFNTDAFTRSTFEYGNSPRNPVVGPGVHVFDLSILKNFAMPFAESQQLQFRAEFFNAFNTPQFAAPGAALGTGTFGVVTATQLDNRQIQFGLKYFW